MKAPLTTDVPTQIAFVRNVWPQNESDLKIEINEQGNNFDRTNCDKNICTNCDMEGQTSKKNTNKQA